MDCSARPHWPGGFLAAWLVVCSSACPAPNPEQDAAGSPNPRSDSSAPLGASALRGPPTEGGFPDAATPEGKAFRARLQAIDLELCRNKQPGGGEARDGATELYTLVDVEVATDGRVSVLRVAGGTLVGKAWESCLVRRLAAAPLRPPPPRALRLRLTLSPPP